MGSELAKRLLKSQNIPVRPASEIRRASEQIASEFSISKEAKSFASNSIETLLRVESKLHGVEMASTHLHEAGSTDTLADIFGVAVACDGLGVFEGEVFCTPVAVGGGTVSFSHGTVSNPAPATLEILKENAILMIPGPEDVELSTPTGVSILGSLAKKGTRIPPPMIPVEIGYGAGKQDLKTAPNILRVIIGRIGTSDLESNVAQVPKTNISTTQER